MNCIRCRAPMKTVMEGEAKVSVEHCICCRGLWFKNKDFLNAVAIPSIGTTGAQFKLEFNCPQCLRLPLYTYRIEGSNQPIQACQKCLGVWVDGGLFLKLKHALQESLNKTKNIKAKENFSMAMNLPKNVSAADSNNTFLYILIGVIAAGCVAYIVYKKF